jgi:hypothetical protein
MWMRDKAPRPPFSPNRLDAQTHFAAERCYPGWSLSQVVVKTKGSKLTYAIGDAFFVTGSSILPHSGTPSDAYLTLFQAGRVSIFPDHAGSPAAA